MSVLFLASHPDTQKPIVVKVLLPKYLKNKEMVSRFIKEAEIIQMSHHPNIVHLYGEGEWEKGLYIAMEFIQGISLRQFIKEKALSNQRAFEIILQVAFALFHLHSHGIIHRDVKPENILITETGEIKVIDFGIAQLQKEGGAERFTQKKRIMGTPVYMSPEQKENPSKVTYSSDIYSLAIIAYELILGRLSHGVIHLSLLPQPIRSILEKALHENPKERYQDIGDFISAITQYMETGQGEEEVPEEVVKLIDHTRSVLIPSRGPGWPQIDVGIAVHEGISLTGLYLDFFHFSNNRYALLLAEPLETGVASLVQASIFRGMSRMSLKKDFIPMKAIQALNETLCQDPINPHFTFALLLLDPEKELLTYISSGETPLWHLPEGSQTVKTLNTANIHLGKNPSAEFLEISDNWRPGDTLILPSMGLKVHESPEWIRKETLLSPQPQAEKVLQKLTETRVERASAVLTLQRIY